MKLRNTIKYRLLEPIILLVAIAAISIGAVAYYAFEANVRQNEVGANAVQASNHAQTVNHTIGKIDALVQDTLDMVAITKASKIESSYEALRTDLNITITKLKLSSKNKMIREEIVSLEKDIKYWMKNARLLLGIDPSKTIPTRFAFTNQTKNIISKTSRISISTENAVNNHSANSHYEFQNELFIVSALAICFLSIITMLLLRRTKSLGSSMITLSKSMSQIVDGNFKIAVADQERQDEVGKMARNLSKFAEGLSELNVVKKEKFLLSHDPLTGLANRSLFTERLEEELTDTTSETLVVALIDLDNFKFINDNMGHDTGDALLVELGKRFQSIADKCDGLVARFGGDEFAMIAHEGKLFDEPAELGELIMAKTAMRFQHNANMISPACSVGFVTIASDDEMTIPEVLKAADVTLYEAKAAGKSCYRVYNERIKALHNRRNYLASILPAAIQNGDIEVFYQPKICLSSGEFSGVEALARWNVNNEQIKPEEFIAIAERTGMIRELDFHVLKEAAKFSNETYRRTGQKLSFSSNMSAKNFSSEEFADIVIALLKYVNIEPELYTIEITESSAVENWDIVVSETSILKEFGIKVSIDDFGTGYSSLSYLQRFKFDEIKIDKEFIGNISENEDSQFLFTSIVNMAKGLGSRIVVEGIETQQQGIIAKQIGCQVGQGFLFGKPMKGNEISNYVEKVEQLKVA